MFEFRPNTCDPFVYNNIVHYNEYRLPRLFRQDDLVIDIGAHIGAFAFAVLRRGGQRVWAVEPDKENFQIASTNLQRYIESGQVKLVHGAVWRSDDNDDVLTIDDYPCFDNGRVNTGGCSVLWRNHGTSVPKFALDSLVLDITGGGQRRVRLLKLDCEGAEWPILFTSRTLHLVDEICGEYHEVGGEFKEIHHNNERDSTEMVAGLEGLPAFKVNSLVQLLTESGFEVTHSRHQLPASELEGLGHFFAKRRPTTGPASSS